MNFPYLRVSATMDSLEVEDIGNCSIRAFNDEGEEYILIIDTNVGVTRIFTYGPIVPDLDLLPKQVNCQFQRLNYTEVRIKKEITSFLNNYIYKITQAKVVDKYEVLRDCRSLIEYMKQDVLY